MSPLRTLTTAGRVLRQLRHDHRTVALVFLMPSVLITILYYVFEGNHAIFNGIAPLMLGIIPFTMMFIVTSVAMLRERTTGTLERLLTSPATKLDILLGYAGAFALLAFVQASIASVVTLWFFDVVVAGEIASLILVAVLSGLAGMAIGLLASSFARSEFQAVQFMPAFVLPQFLTCGLFIPREKMAEFLQYFSDVMPITYVVKALQEIQAVTTWTRDLTISVIVIAVFILVSLFLGAATLKK